MGYNSFQQISRTVFLRPQSRKKTVRELLCVKRSISLYEYCQINVHVFRSLEQEQIA